MKTRHTHGIYILITRKVDYITKLRELGYAITDCHWFLSYFNIGIIVTNSDSLKRKREKAQNKAAGDSMNELLDSKNKEAIQRVIDLGRGGIKYENLV